MDADVRELVERVADMIEERGLATGKFSDAEGRVCTLGAAHLLLGSDDPWMIPRSELGHRFIAQLQEKLSPELITEWNDRQTKGNAVDELRRIAKDGET